MGALGALRAQWEDQGEEHTPHGDRLVGQQNAFLLGPPQSYAEARAAFARHGPARWTFPWPVRDGYGQLAVHLLSLCPVLQVH